jgi:hypothetical protein
MTGFGSMFHCSGDFNVGSRVKEEVAEAKKSPSKQLKSKTQNGIIVHFDFALKGEKLPRPENFSYEMTNSESESQLRNVFWAFSTRADLLMLSEMENSLLHIFPRFSVP